MSGALLVLSAESHAHRRKLGALAWAALEEMALSAVADDNGWYMVGGVREIGASMGVTKDTAARAVAALASAGLVRRERLDDADSTRRSAYRLHLPCGVTLCPLKPDGSARPEVSDASRPTEEPDNAGRHDSPDDGCPGIEDERERHHLSDSSEDAQRLSGCPGLPDEHSLSVRENSADVDPDGQTNRVSAGADVEAVSAAGPGKPMEVDGEVITQERGPRAPRTPSPNTDGRMPRRNQLHTQSAAQGQLFDMDCAVTGLSQDGSR